MICNILSWITDKTKSIALLIAKVSTVEKDVCYGSANWDSHSFDQTPEVIHTYQDNVIYLQSPNLFFRNLTLSLEFILAQQYNSQELKGHTHLKSEG